MRSAEHRCAAPALAALGLALTLTAACGGPAPSTTGAPPAGGHAMPVTVNGALCGASQGYPNKPCVSVTVCVPGTSECQVVDDVLLDTGSYGLRLFRDRLPLALPAVTVAGGALASCVKFADGASDWGPVVTAAVQLGDAAPVTVPMQVIDAGYAAAPASCGTPEASSAAAGLGGILGVGIFLQDCGPTCASVATSLYLACRGASCAPTVVPLSKQVTNPAAMLAGLGNGLVVDLPAVGPGGAPSAAGEVRFGIGAAADTDPAGALSYQLSGGGDLTARLAGAAQSAIVDTGSNGLFLTPPAGSGLAPCPPPDDSWLCTAATAALAADFRRPGGAFGPLTPFRVADAAALLGSGRAVFDDLAGPGFPGFGADFGLPFFLGRRVWIGFEGRSSPLGAGPLVGF